MRRTRADILPGQQYGRLTVVKELPKKHHNRQFSCKCNCGNAVATDSSKLLSGNTQSCGCLRRELRTANNITHGMSGSKLHHVWSNMQQRCSNPNDASYRNYGGRGISVCAEWLAFEPFRAWAMANGYRRGLTIDRRDNDGGYRPDNCRWIPRKEQSANRRSNRLLTFAGQTKTMAQWSRDLDLNYGTLKGRLLAGWPVEKAFAPVAQVEIQTKEVQS